ncbi:MAG: 50S ribosomal protein L30 [Fibrobacteres bacterium]|jgi:large subunit ribosomal protein L30|nr:50S ribosomal protein L30 [Fibrobacterota bacterium]
MSKLKITQLISEVRSSIKQKRTLEALGLRGIRKSVTREKSPTLDGMVRVIAHLVKVEEVK